MEIVPSTTGRRQWRTGRVALGVAGAALVLLGMIAALPVFLGMERVAMADDAMGPALPRGSYVLLRPVSAAELEVGDLVSFRDPVDDGSVIRRVTGTSGGWLRLDGDAAGTEATTMRAVRVRQVVSHTPWVGYPLLVLGAWPAPYLLVGVTGAVVLAALQISGGRRRRSVVPQPRDASTAIPRQAAPAPLPALVLETASAPTPPPRAPAPLG